MTSMNPGTLTSDAAGGPVTLAVVGAGGRGTGYAAWALDHPDRARVVAVAEPNAVRRDRMAKQHSIPAQNVLDDWRPLLEGPRRAQAVLICTQDNQHVEPAVAFLDAGWDVLLEKPMAPSPEDCRRIADAAERSSGLFAVCHVLRYTDYTTLLTDLIADDAIGEVMSIEHLEPVGWWHQAHSFVRGHWRRTDESSPMLLAKSCHDIDWICHVVGRPITTCSSFGRLSHFTAEQRPAEAADRCVDCPLQDTCAYSATRIYVEKAREGNFMWPRDAITDDLTVEGIERAVATGPYGRCVYACDNDVVDHQVVSMEFEGGATGVFTMTAFTEHAFRKTRVFGTQGRLEGDGERVSVFDFRTGQERILDVNSGRGSDAGGGHGGGDEGLMDAFTRAVATRDASLILTGAEESLATHLAVFAAEQSRLERRLVDVG